MRSLLDGMLKGLHLQDLTLTQYKIVGYVRASRSGTRLWLIADVGQLSTKALLIIESIPE